MKYSDFIKEIKVLHQEALALFDKADIYNNPDFRKWNQKLTAGIDLIEEQGFKIKCNIKSRMFTNMDPDPEKRVPRYNMELQDTINELETLINQFDNYGEPKTKATIESNEELVWPSKITLRWLQNHAPISLWVKFISIIIAAFMLGIGFSETQIFKSIKKYLVNDTITVSAFHKPNKALKRDSAKSAEPLS